MFFKLNIKKKLDRFDNKRCQIIWSYKKSYLDKYPERDSIEAQGVVFISIIKNENLCQPVQLKEETIMVRDTSAFDALLYTISLYIGRV